MGHCGRGGGSPLADDAEEDEGEGRAMRTKSVIVYLHWHNGWVLHVCPMPNRLGEEGGDNGEDGPHGLVKESDLD